MCKLGILAISALTSLAFPFAALAQVLKVVEVNAPTVNCVFRPGCTLPVSDTTGNIALPFAPTRTAWLQSRTFTGVAPAAGAGTTGYEYRISMTQASGTGCIFGFYINFGPHKQLPYLNGQLADVYVVTTGGLGTIGVKSAERFGNVIAFTLKGALCADGAPDVSKTTFFIGLAATATPMHVNATIVGVGTPEFYGVDARAPTHTLPADPPGGF